MDSSCISGIWLSLRILQPEGWNQPNSGRTGSRDCAGMQWGCACLFALRPAGFRIGKPPGLPDAQRRRYPQAAQGLSRSYIEWTVTAFERGRTDPAAPAKCAPPTGPSSLCAHQRTGPTVRFGKQGEAPLQEAFASQEISSGLRCVDDGFCICGLGGIFDQAAQSYHNCG